MLPGERCKHASERDKWNGMNARDHVNDQFKRWCHGSLEEVDDN
jgi:hypothetical protein